MVMPVFTGTKGEQQDGNSWYKNVAYPVYMATMEQLLFVPLLLA